MASRGQPGLGGTGSEGSGHERRPHTAIPLKSIETEDSVLVWAQPYLPGETLDKALSFPGPPFLHLFNGGNDHCPADIIKQRNRSERGPDQRLMILAISLCLLFSSLRGLQDIVLPAGGPLWERHSHPTLCLFKREAQKGSLGDVVGSGR